MDPSSSTPEILVQTLLLLLLLLPQDSSSDHSSSSSSSPSLIYISMSPTITASISSTIIKLFGPTVTVVREGGGGSGTVPASAGPWKLVTSHSGTDTSG